MKHRPEKKRRFWPGSDKLWQVNFGFEICSTAGAPETFAVSNYTLASS